MISLNFFSNNISSRRKKLGQYNKIEGWLTVTEATGLFTISTLLQKHANILEIGSWKGKSTWCLAQGLKSGIINCIDPFNAAGETGSKEIYEKEKGNQSLLDQFHFNLKNVSTKIKINVLQGYSNEFVGRVKDIHFLFIDGDHSIDGCKFDYENFEQDIVPGGFLAFHDYDSSRPELGPTWVINNIVARNDKYEYFNHYDSLMVFKKR